MHAGSRSSPSNSQLACECRHFWWWNMFKGKKGPFAIISSRMNKENTCVISTSGPLQFNGSALILCVGEYLWCLATGTWIWSNTMAANPSSTKGKSLFLVILTVGHGRQIADADIWINCNKTSLGCIKVGSNTEKITLSDQLVLISQLA